MRFIGGVNHGNVVVSPVYMKADSTEKDKHGILGLVTSVYARLVRSKMLTFNLGYSSLNHVSVAVCPSPCNQVIKQVYLKGQNTFLSHICVVQ